MSRDKQVVYVWRSHARRSEVITTAMPRLASNPVRAIPLVLALALCSMSATAQVTYRAGYDYDELGRLIRQTNAQGQTVASYVYDPNGNLIRTTDALGRTTEITYDALNRVVASKDPAGKNTFFAYDVGDHITRVTDPRGLVTSYVYDGFGQLWQQTSPDSGTTTFTYDAAGLMTQRTRADGQRLSFGYDAMGRLTSQGGSRNFQYDTCANGKGRLCKATSSNPDSSADVEYAYTPEGEIAVRRDVIQDGNGSTDTSVNYSHDPLGRLSSIAYPSGTTVGYGYTAGRLNAMTARIDGIEYAVVRNVQYQPFGGPESWQYGNGLTRRYNRDLDARITGVSTGSDALVVQSLTYAYDAASEITAITNGVNAALSHNYEYDALSRLIRTQRSGYDERFGYDANGNRTVHQVNQAVVALTYAGSSNRLLSRDGPYYRSASYAYSPQGQRSSQRDDMDTTYHYDAFDRLVGVGLLGSTDTTYIYNAIDQRVASSGFGASSERFVYQGQNQLLSEYRRGGWKDYLWFGNELVGQVGEYGDLGYVHTDHLGRPEVVTGEWQFPVWRAANFAFGREVVQDEIGGLNLGFPGQYWEEFWGFWHNGFRDYDDKNGGYLQTDPIGLAGGVNTYAYVGGKPVNHIDPSGLVCISKNAKNAISAGTGAAVAGTIGSRGKWQVGAASGVVGATVGYFAGTEAAAGVTGFISAATSGGGFAVIPGVIGGVLGYGAEAAGTVTAGGVGGFAESLLNAGPVKSSQVTSWRGTMGPTLKGGAIGAISTFSSKRAEAGVDAFNENFGECDCD